MKSSDKSYNNLKELVHRMNSFFEVQKLTKDFRQTITPRDFYQP